MEHTDNETRTVRGVKLTKLAPGLWAAGGGDYRIAKCTTCSVPAWAITYKGAPVGYKYGSLASACQAINDWIFQ